MAEFEIPEVRRKFDEFSSMLQRSAEAFRAFNQTLERLKQECMNEDGACVFDWIPDAVAMPDAERFIGQRPQWG